MTTPQTSETTFGELAVGEFFWWAGDARNDHNGAEPLVKTAADRYEWSRGFGTAQPHYPVVRFDSSSVSRDTSEKRV